MHRAGAARAGAPRASCCSSARPTRRPGAHLGAKWLCEEHPDKVRADLVINEGGGPCFEIDGRRLYTLCVGEKGVWRFRLRTHGKAGHGSVPSLGDNALLKLGAPAREAARAAAARADRGRASPSSRASSSATSTGAGPDELAAALDEVRERAPLLAAYLAEPMLGVTLVPTMASGSVKDNVIPARAEVLVDCRVPPGLGEDDVRERLEAFFGEPLDGRSRLEFAENVTGNASPAAARWRTRSRPGSRRTTPAPASCRS